eukprot:CAMPEP_0119044378 /NCGR_PEP_ID=MMETSP1177-20130426/31024_1 /TAXON_ID=2985 /ORGANISM="Ochromonas sp, Strain CCMP1899" /LENGTH=380 /DNA_ID=CAMNT_0007014419 /DNA_START=83 /DNA_END=1222 /DNA_ORIENTATION=+
MNSLSSDIKTLGKESKEINLSNVVESTKVSTLHAALANAESEWLFEIVYFLSPGEALNYGTTCKLARRLVCHNYLWDYYSTKFLSGIHSPERKKEFVQEAVLTLNFPSPKSLYSCLSKAKNSLIGWYRIVPCSQKDLPEEQIPSPRGGLVCLRLNKLNNGCPAEVITLEIIEPSGRALCQMKVAYSEGRQKLTCYMERKELFVLKFGQQGGIKMEAISRNSNFLLQPLPHNFERSKTKLCLSTQGAVLKNVSSIIGLFVAPYGSHGLELIHISLIENDKRVLEAIDMQSSESNKPFYVINGLKVTGDANVPAAQLSFTVDVTHKTDHDSWIALDTRPTILFSGNGHMNTTLMGDRQNNICSAYRGKGQINRESDVWDPEW